jgi:hypothetical protein
VALSTRCGIGRAALALSCVLPAPAGAQSLGIVPGQELPGWMTTWSPLNELGTLSRQLPAAAPGRLRLHAGAERIGQFWSAGNPAGLAFELDDARSELSATRGDVDGALRRPLDAASSAVTRVGGSGWQPLGSRGAVNGGVLFDRTLRDPGTLSNVNDPYASSTLVTTDTSTSALRTTRARLEGAGGWRLGAWGVGVALGYDTRTTNTDAAPFTRRNRAVLPAATAGVVRRFADGRLHAGVRAGWQGGEETVSLVSLGATGSVYQLAGYREIPALHIGSTPYYRRTSRNAAVAGVSLGGRAGAGRWVAYADMTRRDEGATNERANDPAKDEWTSTGSVVGGAWQQPLDRWGTLITIQARSVAVDGEATLYPGIAGMRSSERVTEGSAELRLAPLGARWTALARGSFGIERRERDDAGAEASSLIEAVTPAIELELGTRIAPRLEVMGGYAFARYAGSGRIPSSASRGMMFQRLIAPELDIATSVLIAHSGGSALRWRANDRTSIWLTGRVERVSAATSPHTFLPEGTRTGNTVSIGVTMSPVR